MKKLIAFDLDGTLAPSKSRFNPRMVGLFDRLLEKYHVLVISGGKYELFQRQFLTQITHEQHLLDKLHLMPTSGTRYYCYKNDEWSLQYAEDFSSAQKAKIIKALEEGLKESGYMVDKTYGETIEDRGSQVTFSVLGQDVVDHLGEKGVELKEAWDPDNLKKNKLRDYIAPLIPEFEVRVGGVTSIDVTKLGIDKAYGMRKLEELLEISKEDVLFIGDRLQEGGNDYPVKAYGIDTIAIKNWEETAVAVEVINKTR